jgi:hypothetical protein
MNFARIVLALSLALGLSVAAQAKVTHLGKLSDGDSVSTGGVATKSGPHMFSFSDTVTFRLASESDIADIFSAAAGITKFTIDLFSGGKELGSFSGGPAGNPSSAFLHTFDNLAASGKKQNYTMMIMGTATSKARYLNGFSVSAVPEADTWLMLIAGVGLVAFQLRRKQHSLPQRPIS